MARFAPKHLLAIASSLVGAAATFVITTVLMEGLPDALILGASLGVALVVVLIAEGLVPMRSLWAQSRSELVLAVVAGATAFWAAPLIALAQRSSDAPSGSEVLFFTTVAWGALCVALAFFAHKPRTALSGIAGAVGALAGSAALLANWERPSSFSPFIKFPVPELVMLAAGAAFAVASISLRVVALRIGARRTVALAVIGAAVPALLWALPAVAGQSTSLERAWPGLIALGLAVAVFAMGWVRSVGAQGVARASTALLVAPVAVSALTLLEKATASFGPDPVSWAGALSGAAAVLASAAAVWFAQAPSRSVDKIGRGRRNLAAIAIAIASVAFVGSSVALFLPAIRATAEGRGTGEAFFSGTWLQPGYASAGGWLVFAACALALTAALALPERSTGAVVSAGIASLACAAAYPMLTAVTLQTWSSFVPAEVQQAYGTEYAALVLEPVAAPVALVSCVVGAAAAVFSIALALLARGPRKDQG